MRVLLFADDGVTLIDSAEATFSVGVRGTAVLFLDAGSGHKDGREVQLSLEMGQTNVSNDGILYGVEALEVAIDGVDLPKGSGLGFQRLSDRAMTRGASLNCAATQRMTNSTRAAQQARLRSSRVLYDVRNAPRLCGLRRVVYSMVVPLTRNLRGLRLRLLHKVSIGVRVGVIVRALNDLGRAPLEEMLVSVDVPDSGGSLVTTELVLEPGVDLLEPLTGLGGAERVALLLCVESVADYDNEVLLEGPTTPGGKGWVSSWVDNVFNGAEVPTASAGGAPWVPNEVPQSALRFEVQTWKNPANHASGTRAAIPSEYSGLVSELPGEMQVVRAYGPTRLVVEASFENSFFDHVDFWPIVHWVPLGYSEVACIEVRETVIRPYPGYGIRYNALQDPAAADERMIYHEAQQVFQHHGRSLAMGAASNPHDPDRLYAGNPIFQSVWWGSEQPTSHSSALVPIGYPSGHCYVPNTNNQPGTGLPATWGRGAWATYGQPHLYDDDAGAQHVRRWYRAVALVRVCGAPQVHTGKTQEVRLRLVAEDGGGSNRVEGEVVTRQLRMSYRDSLHMHALRGVELARQWRESGLQAVELLLEDTGVISTGQRRIALEIQAADRLIGEPAPRQSASQITFGAPVNDHVIEVMAWACWLAPVPRIR